MNERPNVARSKNNQYNNQDFSFATIWSLLHKLVLSCLCSDGLNQLQVDQEDKPEVAELHHGVICQPGHLPRDDCLAIHHDWAGTLKHSEGGFKPAKNIYSVNLISQVEFSRVS